MRIDECIAKFFFNYHDIKFQVISNESIIKNETLAKNWLFIIRTLSSADSVETIVDEQFILDKFIVYPNQRVGDVISVANRINQFNNEIALFRLAHRGKLKIDLDSSYLNANTEVNLCI